MFASISLTSIAWSLQSLREIIETSKKLNVRISSSISARFAHEARTLNRAREREEVPGGPQNSHSTESNGIIV